jgi:protein TonB
LSPFIYTFIKNQPMKFYLITALALFLATMICTAQDTTTRKQDTAKRTFTIVEISPLFPGGTSAWQAFLGKNLRYPDEALGNEIQGDIVVQFDVDEDGNTSNIKAISGPKKGGLREEAIQIIRISGKWEPASRNGVKIKSWRKETISFKLVK